MTKKARKTLGVERVFSGTPWGKRVEYRGPDGRPWFSRYGRGGVSQAGTQTKRTEPATEHARTIRWRRVAAALKFVLAHAFILVAVEILRELLSSRMGRGA